MTRLLTVAFIFAITTALTIGFYWGRNSPDSAQRISAAAYRLSVLDQSNVLASSVAVTSLINEGDYTSAKLVLRGQIQSSLTVLRALQPTDMSPSDTAVVEDALKQGNQYAKANGL